jgi:CubicO group peptidase (beta-lactamase class C family)
MIMDRWLASALDYIPRWLEFQMRQSEQPGCVIAVAQRGRVVFERAFGTADRTRSDAKLTPRHRFRVASHSKSFTAAAIMKLRERGKLQLDDRVGRHVPDLHPAIAKATIAQLLSHSAGIFRDGTDNGQWQGRKPFPDHAQLAADLREPPVLATSARFKYSNHGYSLAGRVIEAITGERYAAWIAREIVAGAGLAETAPDMPEKKGPDKKGRGTPAPGPLAQGHSGKLPLGGRVIFPSATPTRAFAPATGFVSTGADLVRFFAQLAPAARRGVLAPESRREMIRRQWRDPDSSLERYYGLGIQSGRLGAWDWFGHGGAFQGTITRTACLPAPELAVSVLTNAIDGLANVWLEGVVHILQRFAKDGAPPRRLADWTGRWWGMWMATDLVPVGDRVLAANPALLNPFLDASVLAVAGRDRGRIALAPGFAAHGEPVRLERNARGKVTALWLAGAKLLPEAAIAREIAQRYGKPKR